MRFNARTAGLAIHAAVPDARAEATQFPVVDVLLARGAVLTPHVAIIDSNPATKAGNVADKQTEDLCGAAVSRNAALHVARVEGAAAHAARFAFPLHFGLLQDLSRLLLAVRALCGDRRGWVSTLHDGRSIGHFQGR